MVVQTMALEVAGWLGEGGDLLFLDVRTPWEWELAHVEGSELADDDTMGRLQALDRGKRIVCICHHGIRSQSAALYLVDQGFTNVHNLVGGIDAWSLEVDADVPRY